MAAVTALAEYFAAVVMAVQATTRWRQAFCQPWSVPDRNGRYLVRMHSAMHIGAFMRNCTDDSFSVVNSSLLASENAQDVAAAKPEGPRSQCSACPGMFAPSLEETRMHYRTAWHTRNVQARAHGRPTVSADAFEAEQLRRATGDESSSESSHSDESCSEEYIGSPFIEFNVEERRYMVYKALVFTRVELVERAERFFSDGVGLCKRMIRAATGCHVVFLVRSGRVAAGVFDGASGAVISERMLKRYTTRRKQGGSQAARDASRPGVVRSAGAALRRAGEQHLSEDVQSLIADWKEHLARASFVFWNGTPTARSVLFGDELIYSGDARLRTVPFTTHRPTVEELRRVHAQLFSVHVFKPLL